MGGPHKLQIRKSLLATSAGTCFEADVQKGARKQKSSALGSIFKGGEHKWKHVDLQESGLEVCSLTKNLGFSSLFPTEPDFRAGLVRIGSGPTLAAALHTALR